MTSHKRRGSYRVPLPGRGMKMPAIGSSWRGSIPKNHAISATVFVHTHKQQSVAVQHHVPLLSGVIRFHPRIRVSVAALPRKILA